MAADQSTVRAAELPGKAAGFRVVDRSDFGFIIPIFDRRAMLDELKTVYSPIEKIHLAAVDDGDFNGCDTHAAHIVDRRITIFGCNIQFDRSLNPTGRTFVV
jgi:hypothetical protein